MLSTCIKVYKILKQNHAKNTLSTCINSAKHRNKSTLQSRCQLVSILQNIAIRAHCNHAVNLYQFCKTSQQKHAENILKTYMNSAKHAENMLQTCCQIVSKSASTEAKSGSHQWQKWDALYLGSLCNDIHLAVLGHNRDSHTWLS